MVPHEVLGRRERSVKTWILVSTRVVLLLLFVWGAEPDAALWSRRWSLELLDFVINESDGVALPFQSALDGFQAMGQFLAAGQYLAELYERADDEDVHLHGPWAVQDRREHGHAVFGEGIREGASAATPRI